MRAYARAHTTVRHSMKSRMQTHAGTLDDRFARKDVTGYKKLASNDTIQNGESYLGG